MLSALRAAQCGAAEPRAAPEVGQPLQQNDRYLSAVRAERLRRTERNEEGRN